MEQMPRAVWNKKRVKKLREERSKNREENNYEIDWRKRGFE